ncbi:MAG: hypothetical protein LBV02_02315 [Bacteroidales bacterium]|jgi:hypothetical protein|nr:hypothetical protein [Bacteroidales bacterium]
MKKINLLKTLFLLISTVALFTACDEKPTETPSEEPSTSTKKISAIYDLDDNNALLAKYIWNGNKLTKIENYENGFLDYTETFTYNGSLLTQYDCEDETVTFSYENNLLSKIVYTYSGSNEWEEYTVAERNGNMITRFDIKVYSDYSKRKTEKRQIFKPLQNREAFFAKLAGRNTKETEIDELSLEFTYSGNNIVTETWTEYDNEYGDYAYRYINTYDNKTNPFKNIFMSVVDAEYWSVNNCLTITEENGWDSEYPASSLYATNSYEYNGDLPVKATITYPWDGGIDVYRMLYEYK